MSKIQQKKTPRRVKVEKAAKDNQYYELTDLYEIAGEADKFHALKTILDQEGGQVLLEHYIKSAVAGVDALAQYETLSYERLISICALIHSNLQSARALSRAADNLSMADEALEEALQR